MGSFDIGLSALTASQKALDLAGQNLANAATPGYHRQAALLSSRTLGSEVGAGVEVTKFRRFYDISLERALTDNVSRTGRVDAELTAYRRLESLYAPGPGTLSDRTGQLFDQLAALTARPDDMAQRQVFLKTASGLAGELNTTARALAQVRSDLRHEVDDSVAKLNAGAADLARLNRQIEVSERTGRPANDLRDQRDLILNDIASRVDVRVIDQPYGVVNVIAANVALVVGGTSLPVEATTNATGALVLRAVGTTTSLQLSQGSLAGQVNAHNDILTGREPELDAFARALATGIDTLQATGIGLGGPGPALTGSRPLTSSTAPLASVSPLPTQAGSLFISVTDQATGQRTLTEVPFDPAAQSLQDLAGAVTAATAGQVQGAVTSDNRLQLQAQTGYSFDFAGRPPSEPTNVVMGGSAAPAVSGSYSGTGNGNYQFQVVGSGTVGVTPGLRLEVRDINGDVVRSLNIGQGYSPGAPLDAGNGLMVRIGAGTTAAGSFSVPVVSQADTTGALAATGTGSVFQGTGALDLQVRPEVLGDPRLLAGSRDGQPGDAANFRRMEALRDQPLLGTETLVENLASRAAAVGTALVGSQDKSEALLALGQSLQAQQQGVSGVDLNEEALTLLKFQRQYQAATRFITVVNSTLDDLLNIIR